MKASRAVAERKLSLRHAAASAVEGAELRGALLPKGGLWRFGGLEGGYCRSEGRSKRSEAANSPPAVPVSIHLVDTVVGCADAFARNCGTSIGRKAAQARALLAIS